MLDKDETIRSLSEEIQRLREQLLQENSRFTKQLEERERQLNQELSQMQQVFRSKEVENQHLREQHQQANSRAARQLEERERQLNQELRQVNQQLRRVHYEKGRQLEERERQLGRVNQQLETAELVVAQFEKRVTELEQQLSQREQQNPESSIRVKKLPSFKLRWRKGKRAPCAIGRDTDAVVDGNMVYLRNRNTEKVYSCDVTTGRWSQLPNCTRKTCSLTIINGWLTTVGDGKLSNELFSLTGKGKERQWTKKFPPMPTKRQLTTSLCTGTALVVAGGWGVGGILSTIEVMNTETLQWSTADDLPQPMYFTSATVCGDCISLYAGGKGCTLESCQVSLHLFSECPHPVLCSQFIGSKS